MTPKEDEAATKLAKDSLQRHEDDLLKDIFHQYNIAFSSNNPSQIHRTLAYFSALLIKLSRQAEESTKKMIRLTWALFGLTVALLVVAIVQIVIFKQDANTNIHREQKQEYQQQQTENKPVRPIQPLPPNKPIRDEIHK